MTKSSTTNFIKSLIFIGIFIIPFIFLVCPSDPGTKDPNNIFFFANNFYFPFITSKAFVFRMIVEIITVLTLILMLRDRKYVPKFSWLSVSITAFAIFTLIADLFGLNPLRSIWSNFERMEGWMAIVHIWAYFMVLSCVFTEKKYWHRFFNTTIFVAFCVSIYGLVQFFGGAQIHQGSTRIDASLGNAIYLAVYMLFHLFISVYMIFVAWAKKQKVAFWIYIILSIFFGFILFETGTRGTIIGLLGGTIITLLILFIFAKGQKLTRIVSGSILVLIILLGIIFYFNRNSSFVQNNETLRRLASISWEDTKTQARGFIWPMAIKGAFESPKTILIGTGQENFNYIFNKNYNPKMWNQEQWFDRAHNVFLDWLTASGVIGLLLYLSLFVLAIVLIWRSNVSLIEKALFTGLIVAYGIHNIFVFDNLASYVLFFSILAFLHVEKATKPISWIENKVKSDMETYTTIRDYIIVPVSVVLLGIILYSVNIRPIQANTRLVAALQSCGRTSADATIETFEKVISTDKYMANQETREQIVSCAGTILSNQFPNDQKQKFLEFMNQEVDRQITSTPGDARMYVLAGAFFNSIGAIDQAKPLLEKAHELSPNKQLISNQLATLYINRGKTEEALDLFKKSYESDPTFSDSKLAYAYALITVGKENESRKLFNNDPEIFDTIRAARVYASIKNYTKSIDILQKILKNDEKNQDAETLLAQIQYTAGMKYQAIQTLQNLIKHHPELKSGVEGAIKEIEAGK